MMMLLFFSITHGFTAPKYTSPTIRLSEQRSFIQTQPAPDYWALQGYYLPQATGAACSLASWTMVFNALRNSQSLTADQKLFTQESIAKTEPTGKWSKLTLGRMAMGTTLTELEAFVRSTSKALRIEVNIQKVHASSFADFEKVLLENEKSDQNFLVVNYLQGVATGDPEGTVGHLAPVAAYDQKNQMVLIFDPDREYYEPYWVKTEQLFRAMNTTDPVSKQTRGWIFVDKATR